MPSVLKVWTSDDFEGHWPVGTAAVIVAPDEESARELLLKREQRSATKEADTSAKALGSILFDSVLTCVVIVLLGWLARWGMM